MKHPKTISALILGVLCFTQGLMYSQSVLNVGASETYTTIAAAVSAASTGDTINIVDAVITENNISVQKSIIIRGQGMSTTIVQANTFPNSGSGRVFATGSGYTVDFIDLTIRYGSTTSNGGGIVVSGNATFTRCHIDQCTGLTGGGILVSPGAVTLTDCHVSNCSTTADAGGGIFSSNGITATNCTFNGNHAAGGNGGGAIHAYNGPLTLENCTITENTANFAGAISALGTGTITNCTITHNSSPSGGGLYPGNCTVKNTILSDNYPKNCSYSLGVTRDLGNNLEDSLDCGCTATGSLQNTDPQLQALADNGGPTMTMALLTSSPAINPAIDNGAPTYDQRGYPRTLTADIGAYEAFGIVPVELQSFNGQLRNGLVSLKWNTATEVNNMGFEVERNYHGSWEFAGFVDGHGTTNSPHQYSFTDTPPQDAHSIRYRLKQVDRDGAYEYSPEIMLSITSCPLTATLNGNYPNPFNPSTEISYTLPGTTPVLITIYNALGVPVTKLVDETQDAGTYLVHFNAKNQPGGMYFISMETTYGKQIRKMTLTK